MATAVQLITVVGNHENNFYLVVLYSNQTSTVNRAGKTSEVFSFPSEARARPSSCPGSPPAGGVGGTPPTPGGAWWWRAG